jgi:Family of unknown function (DUF5695)
MRKLMRDLKRLAVLAIFPWWGTAVPAQTVYTNAFNVSINYLTNGIAGTIYDGVYFGAGEFNNTGVLGPGATIQCDANITAAGELTLQTTGTAWEYADDDGFFLFKVVPGDFSATVHVVSPFDASAYNTAGLQARAFAADGDPFNGAENFVSWTRFDEYGFANYLRSEAGGNVAQINPGDYPNSNYWLRMDRVNGTNFIFYQKATKAAVWQQVSFPSPVSGTKLVRADLAGRPLQVGIIHATFNGQLGVQFTDFTLSVSNSTPVAAPLPPSGLTLATNALNGVDVSWQPGAGSAGSVVVVWPGTNHVVQEMPANGTTYTGNASYGLGANLPASGYYVIYAGSGTNATINNLALNTTYNVAVFSSAGSGNSITYNHAPAVGSVTVPPNQIWAQLDVGSGGVTVMFSANPGEWYWLQYSDSLEPANWQDVMPGPAQATGTMLSIFDAGGGSTPQRYYRLQQVDPLFAIKVNSGNITSLRYTDSQPPEYVNGGKLGTAIIDYQRSGSATWNTVQTATLNGVASVSYYTNASTSGTQYTTHCVITNGLPGAFVYESVFTIQQDQIFWRLNLTNLTGQPMNIGDLALPLPMNTAFSSVTSSTMKHSFISGSGSFIFWMRPDSLGPRLLMTPDAGTRLEYWDVLNGYEVYIHSQLAASNAAAQYPAVTTQGDRWRQPTTSLTLPAGGSQNYGFKFQWANDYDAIRQALVNNGKVDVHIVPGMTVPTNLFAKIALNTTQTVSSVTAEFPAQTQLQFLGTTNVGSNTYQLYQVQFSRLGENKLTVNYGGSQTMYLDFFVTEPLETLIKKRAAYLVGHQAVTNQWYGGLFCDFNMNDGQLITPDNHDTLDDSFQVYEIASDDAGESRPAYLAAKEAVYPVQSEISALDYYITNFVWGGLQRTTNETYSYGIYGVPDWHTLRTGNNISIGRGYDYPHIIVMYYGMYQVAKYHPEIITALSAHEYLQRAWGTAMALWSYGGSQATQVGLMNELVISDVIDALQVEGMTSQAASLRANWEAKVNYYVGGNADLFASEYAFDATGFESQQAYVKYASQHAGSSPAMGSANLTQFLAQLKQFSVNQITANVFDRGWLETAYYYYGSDYRGDMGDDFVVTYMAQMGGWGLLDYALNYSTNYTDYLRLGYASYLCGWSTMNSGTPDSNYGFWYPGVANDGGCGGGFEPSPANLTWLNGQPMHRGAWYYSAEQNLGFCGAIRSGATILTDDPIFGRFCYGGAWTNAIDGIEIIPLDGVRQRFHAMLNSGNFHLILDNDGFATAQPIVLQPDLSQISFQIESGNATAHSVSVHLTVPTTGTYSVTNVHGVIATLNLQGGQETATTVPMDAGVSPQSFGLVRTN